MRQIKIIDQALQLYEAGDKEAALKALLEIAKGNPALSDAEIDAELEREKRGIYPALDATTHECGRGWLDLGVDKLRDELGQGDGTATMPVRLCLHTARGLLSDRNERYDALALPDQGRVSLRIEVPPEMNAGLELLARHRKTSKSEEARIAIEARLRRELAKIEAGT
jgi:hypothetical protein